MEQLYNFRKLLYMFQKSYNYIIFIKYMHVSIKEAIILHGNSSCHCGSYCETVHNIDQYIRP